MMYDQEWRYLPYGRVRHAIIGHDKTRAYCGAQIRPADEWRGTGNQDEYERNAALPMCAQCAAMLGPRP